MEILLSNICIIGIYSCITWILFKKILEKGIQKTKTSEVENLYDTGKPSHWDLTIINPDSLSFAGKPYLRSKYGADIRLSGVGSGGVYIYGYLDKTSKRIWPSMETNKAVHLQMNWRMVMDYFPEYTEEILAAAMTEAERELNETRIGNTN